MSSNVASDRLAEIAGRGAALSRELVEQLPPGLPDLNLPPLEFGAAKAFVPRPGASPESLQEELVAARAAMEPFLRDTAPELPVLRRAIMLRHADWRLEPARDWQEVAIPHYGGPTGKARAWYRFSIDLAPGQFEPGTLWVCFGGVDYIAAVFFNGEFVGQHEGFFSPFEFEVTHHARVGRNELLVRVDNDAICMGNDSWNDPRQGDKIYAATGLGWNEPGTGWHHCPPGMGIHRPVRIESRPRLFLRDLFVRPIPGEEAAEAWIEVFNTGETPVAVRPELTLHGANFHTAPRSVEIETPWPEAAGGVSRYRARIPMPEARRWSPDTPWMYALHAVIGGDGMQDALATEFGMRVFILDESPGPDGRRGRFLLDGKPVRLRGANTMGHEQQCVFRGDFDQLRDDLLLAKLAHLNFLRFTQRPVEPEVYRMCDRLGMMAQTDLPLFAHLRRNQFAEAVRQAVEMERLTRAHPSCVLASFINEPFPAAWGDKSHRHLNRLELEDFFTAATAALRVENPDRQVKPIDGDYEPPGPGLPDNHCYTGWYNGHGIELGKLHKGFWLPVKPGWNYACGEFGSEGLDFEEVMRGHYPAAWLPDPAKGPEDESTWSPSKIHRAQTGSHFHFWMEPGDSMAEWIARSQAHQAWITRLMTEAFRRDNRMVSFAIHLFIDAWPAGWMKTIMDCRRNPKPAYFAYREALAPLAVFFRTDRTAFFSGETFEGEVWICNDRETCPEGLSLSYQLVDGGRILSSAQTEPRLQPVEAAFQGRIALELPEVAPDAGRRTLQIQVGLLDADGTTIHDSTTGIEVFARINPPESGARLIGATGEDAAQILPRDWLICTDPAGLDEALAEARSGANVLLLGFPEGRFTIDASEVRVETCGMDSRHFVARDRNHPVAQCFRENDFRFWFDPALDRPSPLLKRLFFADESWRAILHTGQLGWGIPAQPALAVAERPLGKGRIVFCELELAGRLANPVANLFLHALAASGRGH